MEIGYIEKGVDNNKSGELRVKQKVGKVGRGEKSEGV